jgi:hypothetical protein
MLPSKEATRPSLLHPFYKLKLANFVHNMHAVQNQASCRLNTQLKITSVKITLISKIKVDSWQGSA